MIKLGENYSVAVGAYGIGVFDVIATTEKELVDFWEQNKATLDHPCLHEEERVTKHIQFKITDREKIENLAYRFNICLQGHEAELTKKTFLSQFASEAIQAIIYATDYIPDSMSIDQYVAAILHAFDQYGDSTLFDDRIINIAIGDPVHAHSMAKVAEQIEMFKNLLSIPSDVLFQPNGEL